MGTDTSGEMRKCVDRGEHIKASRNHDKSTCPAEQPRKRQSAESIFDPDTGEILGVIERFSDFSYELYSVYPLVEKPDWEKVINYHNEKIAQSLGVTVPEFVALMSRVPVKKTELTGDIVTDVMNAVNHPAHYGGDVTYEAIKVIQAWGLGFELGNTVKYISRAGKKSSADELEDLRKAAWYIEARIKLLKEGPPS